MNFSIKQTAKETWYGIEDISHNILVCDRGDPRPYMRKRVTTAEREIEHLHKRHASNRYRVVQLHIQYSIVE